MTTNRPIAIRGLREPRQRGDLIVPTGQQLLIVLDVYIRAAEDGTGLTDNDAMERLDMNNNSFRARRTELERLGWLKNSGYAKRVESGRRAVVWVLTPKGGEQAGLVGYRVMAKSRTDPKLIKVPGTTRSKNLRRKAVAPTRPVTSHEPSPEELELQFRRNFFNECRVLIERSVLNFTKTKAPDVTEFGAFLGNDGVGSPGFSPFEIRQVAKYLERVSAAYEANRARSNYSPVAIYEPRKDI